MTTWLLVALLTVSGDTHAYVLDHSLTYEDCQTAKDAGLRFATPPLRHLQGAVLECEPETEKETE